MAVIYCMSSELLPRHYLICSFPSGLEGVILFAIFQVKRKKGEKSHKLDSSGKMTRS